MISVYSIVETEKKVQVTGVWRGDENTAPDGCVIKGKFEAHYWVMDSDEHPNRTTKCLCGKEKYTYGSH
jgi:hypothetical protein